MKTIQAVDLFCGAGGASVGLRRACAALGLEASLLAVNHWPTAVATHSLNHPAVRHLCESVERINPRTVVPKGRLQLLIAAPECTHHSTARGGRPIHDQSRATAWHILKWCQELYVEHVIIENVPEFREWGPLGANGRPLKSRKGETYQAFLAALRSLGYRVDARVLNAADYGDPTTRRRLFILARRGAQPIKWPLPTHSRDGRRTLVGPTRKWRAAREVIDWSIQGTSIFDRKRPLSAKTMARILAGLERFGGPTLEPFLVILRNHAAGRSLDDPLPTIAAQGQHVALAQPFILSQASGGAPRPVSEPVPTIVTDGYTTLVEPFLVPPRGFSSGPKVDSVDVPLRTIVAASGHNFAVVQPFIAMLAHGDTHGRGNSGRVRSVEDPLGTIHAGGGNHAVVEPFLIPHYGERPTQVPRTHSVDDPVPTIPATGSGKFELVEPFLASYYGTQNIRPVSEPLPTVTAKDRFALVMPVVNGQALDVRLRMLTPPELAAAMSFDADYQFAGNQGEQVKQIGNAWPCALGQALIQTVLADYAVPARRRTRRVA